MLRIKVITTVCLLGAVLSLCACKDTEQETSLYSEELLTPEQANYNTIQVEEGTYTASETGSLTLYYPVTADLAWEKEEAYIREILVKSGQEVKKGDDLIVFDVEASTADSTELSLTIARLKEEIAAEKQTRLSAIEDAQQDAAGLTGHELQIAVLKTEKLKSEYEQYVYEAERQIAQYQESLQKLQEEVQNNTLVAPFDGVIDSVASYHEGDLVETNEVLISMHGTDKFYLATKTPSDTMRYNMEVTIQAGRNNNIKNYTGRVVTAGNAATGAAAHGDTLIELTEEVSAEEFNSILKYECIIEEVQNVLLIDSGAVHKEGEKKYVYVLDGDMVQKRYIVTGLSNTEKTWVLDGLSLGQSVIVN